MCLIVLKWTGQHHFSHFYREGIWGQQGQVPLEASYRQFKKVDMSWKKKRERERERQDQNLEKVLFVYIPVRVIKNNFFWIAYFFENLMKAMYRSFPQENLYNTQILQKISASS